MLGLQALASGMLFFLAAVTFLLAAMAHATVGALAAGWVTDVIAALIYAGVVGMVAGVGGALLAVHLATREVR